MDTRKTSLERAFDMAQTGSCTGISEILRTLQKEGYDCRQIEGRQVRKQLSDLMKKAKAKAEDPA